MNATNISELNGDLRGTKKAKVEIAVAKGKKHHDKRHTKKKRDWERERARYFRKSS